jgi:hypothetical protein
MAVHLSSGSQSQILQVAMVRGGYDQFPASGIHQELPGEGEKLSRIVKVLDHLG